VKATILASCIS